MIKLAPLKALYCKEFRNYFNGPLGYTFLVVFLFGLGQLTFEVGRGSFFYLRQSSLDPFFDYIPWMFLFLVPAITMRLWAEERRSGTIELLLTFPISLHEAVLAKFLASWSFVALALLGTFPMVITVIYLGNPDFGAIFMGHVASLLTAGALLAIGSFFSAISKNQVVCFILTAVVSYFFVMAGSPPVLDFASVFLPQYGLDLIESLSILNHFDSMKRGVLRLSDLWFFFVLTATFLYANIELLKQNKAD